VAAAELGEGGVWDRRFASAVAALQRGRQ